MAAIYDAEWKIKNQIHSLNLVNTHMQNTMPSKNMNLYNKTNIHGRYLMFTRILSHVKGRVANSNTKLITLYWHLGACFMEIYSVSITRNYGEPYKIISNIGSYFYCIYRHTQKYFAG